METSVVPSEPEKSVLIDSTRLRTISDVSEDCEAAADNIYVISGTLRIIGQADVYQRYVLGRQLTVIRENALWKSIAGPGEEVQSGCWDDWLGNEFRDITGLSKETAYGACQIAAAPFLQQRTEDEIRDLGRLGNVRLLARIERSGTPVTDQMVQDAKEMPEKQFRESVGLPDHKRRITTVVSTPENAQSIDTMLGILRNADDDAVDPFVEAVGHYMETVSGDNPTDALDGIRALILQDIQKQMDGEYGLPSSSARFDELDEIAAKEDTDHHAW